MRLTAWSTLVTVATLMVVVVGSHPQRKDRGRSVSPLLLRSLAASGDSDDDEDDDDEVVAAPAPVATPPGPLCQLDCSEERLRPVCGTDGATYPSRCHLQQAICQGNSVRLDYRGECSDSETRCLEERLLALKTSNESGIPVFVPVCREDGSYVEVQCHYGTGYCWCVNQDGKPVPGTSIRYDRPKCKNQEQRRRNRRGKKKRQKGAEPTQRACTQADRSEFNSHVTELIMSEFGSLHGRTVPEGKITDHKKERIEWKFDQMDVNRNGRLRKKEFKTFRRKIRRLARNKVCARHFWQYCDMDNDGEITKGEWNNCLGVNVNISFKLFMSLSSEDDQQGKRRKDKSRKRKEEDEEEMNRDDEVEVTDSGSALLDSPETNPGRDGSDCKTVHREAIESTKSGVPNAYIPECDANGNFNTVQCHKSSGYCWCANEITGEPISSTSVYNSRPDCSNSQQQQQQQPQHQPWIKCPENKKKIFQERLMNFLTRMAEAKSDDSLRSSSGETLDESVARWHFNHLDSNRDGRVSRRELRGLRNSLKLDPELRGCGKRLQFHCDANSDTEIDLEEWNACLGLKRDDVLSRIPSNPRKGPNPLNTWLMSD